MKLELYDKKSGTVLSETAVQAKFPTVSWRVFTEDQLETATKIYRAFGYVVCERADDEKDVTLPLIDQQSLRRHDEVVVSDEVDEFGLPVSVMIMGEWRVDESVKARLIETSEVEKRREAEEARRAVPVTVTTVANGSVQLVVSSQNITKLHQYSVLANHPSYAGRLFTIDLATQGVDVSTVTSMTMTPTEVVEAAIALIDAYYGVTQ